jgi:hypothetical protein
MYYLFPLKSHSDSAQARGLTAYDTAYCAVSAGGTLPCFQTPAAAALARLLCYMYIIIYIYIYIYIIYIYIIVPASQSSSSTD